MAGLAGAPGAIWHTWQTALNGPWSGWASHGAPGGGSSDSPALAANADGRLELVVAADDANLWTIEQVAPSDGWSGWTRRPYP